MDENTIKQVENKVGEGFFRNKSHLIEYAVMELLKGGKDGSS